MLPAPRDARRQPARRPVLRLRGERGRRRRRARSIGVTGKCGRTRVMSIRCSHGCSICSGTTGSLIPTTPAHWQSRAASSPARATTRAVRRRPGTSSRPSAAYARGAATFNLGRRVNGADRRMIEVAWEAARHAEPALFEHRIYQLSGAAVSACRMFVVRRADLAKLGSHWTTARELARRLVLGIVHEAALQQSGK